MKELTDEELNSAICKWRGWEILEAAGTAKAMYRQSLCTGAESTDWKILPSHILGREALGNMHEAENEWIGNDHVRSALYKVSLRTECHRLGVPVSPTERAAPRQRAIALLRVVKPEIFE